MTLPLLLIPLSFALSAAAVGGILCLSQKKAWYDSIDPRKIHTGHIPRLGGAGFAPVFIVAAFIITLNLAEPGLRFFFPLAALILILISGIADDFLPLSYRVKLFVQIAAALCVVIPGYTFQKIVFIAGREYFPGFAWFRYPLSFLWIVGLTNAINLIDGADGLAGGISALAALTYAGIFISLTGTGPLPLYCLCLAAAIAGFLIYNLPLPRARIFMGDGGSQFLGFVLALLPLLGLGKSSPSTSLSLLHAAAILIIPIFDTIAAVWRRVRDKRSITSPDKFHVHHKLITLGLSARGVDGILWGLQIILGILVILSVNTGGGRSFVFLGAAYAAGTGFFAAVHFMNRNFIVRQRARAPQPAEGV